MSACSETPSPCSTPSISHGCRRSTSTNWVSSSATAGLTRGEPAFSVVSLDAFSIGLSKTDVLPASGRTAFWLYTDNLEREIERLRASGVAIVAEPAGTEWGERMATISDPDGNLVHIGQRL